MEKPVTFLVKRDELIPEGIKQFYVDVSEECKVEALCDLYETLAIKQSVIFVSSRRKVHWLSREMHTRDLAVSAIHGGIDRSTSNKILHDFRSGSSRVLITTEMYALGIDVEQVSVVLNYDLPTQPEIYLHRIGRTGRFGREGIAINFVTEDDWSMVTDIQNFFNVIVEELPANFADIL